MYKKTHSHTNTCTHCETPHCFTFTPLSHPYIQQSLACRSIRRRSHLFTHFPQHQFQAGARILKTAVSRIATLYVTIETCLRQVLKCAPIGEATRMRECDRCVDDRFMHYSQHTQIIVQTMTDQYGLGIDQLQ